MSEERLICTVAIELGRSRWLVGALPPRGTKVTVASIGGGDTERLMEHLNKVEARLKRDFGQPVELKVCFEAGYDGFWLARFLRDRGLDVDVLDASSLLVSRRGRRTKTDRIDVEAMAFALRTYLAGDPSVCRIVAMPTPEAEITRAFERLHLVLDQIKVLEAERRDALLDPASTFPDRSKVATLTKLAGVGELSATLLVTEVFHRSFSSRRHLASYPGLAPTPCASGDVHRDQGISKAGNKPARTLLVEITWAWMRHQPTSGLTAWYRARLAQHGARSRKVGIVAMARKLAIALWHFVEHGIIPPGAVLNGR